MAATWIKPLHVNKGKTIAQTIKDRTDYAENPDKTREGELITGYMCESRTVDTEFLLSKHEYANITGRNQGGSDVLAYHLRQAFKPGEVTPEMANKIGYELAMRFTRGKHAFIVCSHEDKNHVHSHIIFNATTLDGTRKFVNFWGSSFAIRKLSDIICIENGLSVIEKPKLPKGHYGTWLGDKKEPTWREKLEATIDTVLAKNPADFEIFLQLLREENIEVKQGKYVSLLMSGQKRFTRLRSLGNDYSEDAILDRISGKRVISPKRIVAPSYTPPKTVKMNLLIDIQNCIKAQSSPGYERWAKIFNLKQAAQTLIFLQENDITEIDSLDEKAQQAKDDFNSISLGIKSKEKRLQEITDLQKHIGVYSKTKEVYAQYKSGGFSKKFLSLHNDEIEKHKAAKQHFNLLGFAKLPTIKALQTEYATVLAENKKLHSSYNGARKFMQEILTSRQNVQQLLNYKDTQQEKKNEKTER